jgi:RNA polymerase sigma factor (sigma-70 family)
MTHPGIPGSADAPGPPLAVPAVGRPPVVAGERPGDEREFARFYREFVTRLVAYLVYQGATTPLAADIAQDAMIVAYRRWPEITSPKAYVYSVAYREFLRQALAPTELPVGEVPEPSAILPRPEETEAWLQERQIVQMLRALPPRQRQVLALTIDGWAPAEIAEMLGIDPRAVRSNLRKARRRASELRRRTEEEEEAP